MWVEGGSVWADWGRRLTPRLAGFEVKQHLSFHVEIVHACVNV